MPLLFRGAGPPVPQRGGTLSICPTCKGDRVFVTETIDGGSMEVACPDCNGTGHRSACHAESVRHTHCTKYSGHPGSHYDGERWWSFDRDTGGRG